MQECEKLINIQHELYLKSLSDFRKKYVVAKNSKLYYIYKLLVLKETLLIKKLLEMIIG